MVKTQALLFKKKKTSAQTGVCHYRWFVVVFFSLQTEYLHSYVLTSPKLFRLDFNEYAVLLTVGGAALWETG